MYSVIIHPPGGNSTPQGNAKIIYFIRKNKKPGDYVMRMAC